VGHLIAALSVYKFICSESNTFYQLKTAYSRHGE